MPDVALAADSNTSGYLIFNGAETTAGGTSWATPTLAAFCAILNQARADFDLGPLGNQFNSLIYPLSGTSAFRDITTGVG